MKVFFIANQDLCDRSAHALYSVRNAWWLAHENPDLHVELWHAPHDSAKDPLTVIGLSPLPNLHIVALPNVRKKKGSWGLTLNSVFHIAAYLRLVKHSSPGDILIVASFPKVFRVLNKSGYLRKRLKFVYEVHQLAVIDDGELSSRARHELRRISTAELFLVTTQALGDVLRKHLPKARIERAPLGCGIDPATIPDAPAWRNDGPIRAAYLGSVYREQGVEWLTGEWEKITKIVGRDLELHIIGGSQTQVDSLRKITRKNEKITLHGQVGPGEIGEALKEIDLLIIPSLAEGRMPFVAITKAYDYLALKRPILAANLPSIQEVLRDEQEALLFHPGSTPKLAAALRRIIDTPVLREKLIFNTTERAAEFTWTRRSQLYGQWLQKLGVEKS